MLEARNLLKIAISHTQIHFPSLDDGFRHPLEEFFEQMRAPVRTIMTEITELTCECRKCYF